MDPQDKINDVYNEINSFFMVYSEAPIFGVDFSLGIDNLLIILIMFCYYFINLDNYHLVMHHHYPHNYYSS